MFTRSIYGIVLLLIVLALSACAKLDKMISFEMPDVDMPRMQLPDWAWGDPEPVTVTILHANDLHSQLEPLTVSGEPEQGGAARTLTLINRIRDEKGKDNVFLLSAGDYFQGSLFYNVWKGSAEIMVMNELGYDAACLGNHEFDLGAKELARALNGGKAEIAGELHDTQAAEFIVLGTNVDATALPELDEALVKHAIVKKGGERFGLLGVTTESAKTISNPGEHVTFENYVQAVQREVALLEEKGINKIILLSHAGSDEDIKRVPQLSGVDIIIAGHDHALFGDAKAVAAMGLPKQAERIKNPYPTVLKDRDGHNVLVVSAFEKGRWLGNIDVTFDENGLIHDGAWQAAPIFIRGCDGDDCSGESAAADAGLAAKIAEYNHPIEVFANEVVGEAATSFAGRHSEAEGAASMGNLVADILLAYTRESDGTSAAVVNRGGIRSSIEKGPVRFKDVNAVLPFPNTAVVIELSGLELLNALDYAVTGAGGQSFGAFPQVAGMEIRYCTALPCPDALLPETGVITELKIDGEPVDMEAEYRIATNDYMARGGDYYEAFKRICTDAERYCRDTGSLLKDVVADWFRNYSPVEGNTTPRVIPLTATP